MAKLTPLQIKLALSEIQDWKKQRVSIARTFHFQDFVGAMKFVNQVARVAEAAAHHPDIDIRWNKVTLTLSTHSAGGLTRKDFALAKEIDGFTTSAK